MDYSNADGLELLVILDIVLNREHSKIFKRRFDYVNKIYKKNHPQINYLGLIQVTAAAYSYINDEKNPDKNLQDEFYEKLKLSSATMDKIMELSPKKEFVMDFMIHLN